MRLSDCADAQTGLDGISCSIQQKVSEYDQKVPQSHTADQLTVLL